MDLGYRVHLNPKSMDFSFLTAMDLDYRIQLNPKPMDF